MSTQPSARPGVAHYEAGQAPQAAEVTKVVANFIASTRYDDLPRHVVEAAKRIILDTLGCAMGAIPTDLGRAALRLVETAGGRARATVAGTGQRTSALMAAYANGRLSNILDFDETFMLRGHHAHSTVAGALATCEDAGRHGKRLLAAVAVGFELGARLGLYVTPQHVLDESGRAIFWHLAGPVMGVYGSCAAAAVALDLEPEQVEHALGLCGHYLPGAPAWSRQRDLPTIKYEDTGWLAQAGIMTALNARQGITGIRDIFLGEDGLAKLVSSPGEGVTPGALVEGLGQHWWVPYTSYKLWPCCRYIHYALTAFAEIVRNEGLAPDDIEEVRLLTFPQAQAAPCFQQQEVGPNLVATSFSYPHAAAMVALGVPPGPRWFAPEVIHSDAATALRRRVFTGVEPTSLNPKAWGLEEGVIKMPSRVEVRARGRVLSRLAEFALGDPWDGAPPFGDAELTEKFRRLALALAPSSALWQHRIEEIIRHALHLEEVDDLHEFTLLLSPSSSL